MIEWSKLAIVMLLGSSLTQADPLSPLRAPVSPQYARPAATGFEGYKLRLADRARREGVREATIANTIPALTYNPRVVRLDALSEPQRRLILALVAAAAAEGEAAK